VRLGAGLAGGAALFGAVTMVARLAGFARWAVFSGAVGSTAAGSAYTAANALPNVLFEVAAGGALAAVAVPLLAAPLADGRLGKASQTASCLMTWALTVLAPLGLALFWAAEPLAAALLDGAVERQRPGSTALAAGLIRLFALQVPLYGVGVVASGVLQAAKRLFWPAAAPLLSSLTVIAAYLVFGQLAGGAQDSPGELGRAAVLALGWGTTAGVAALTLPLLGPVARLGIRWRWTYRFGAAGERRRAAGLAGAGIGALLAQQLAALAVVALAGWVGGAGALPTYHYAQAVYLLPYAVLAVPLAMSAFPRLAQWAAAGRLDRLEAGVAGTTRAVLAVSALGAAWLVAAAPSAQALFDLIDRSGQAAGLAPAVVAFAPGLVGYGLMAHLQRVLYAVDRSGPAVAATAAGWLVVAAAAVVAVLAGPGGAAPTVAGLAGATSLGVSVAGAGLLWQVKRALGPGAVAGLGRTAWVGLGGAATGALAGRLVADQVAAWVAGAGGGQAGAAAPAPTAPAGAALGLAQALSGGLAGCAAAGAIALAAAWALDRSLFHALPRAPRG
jgi:putative peptidoglycan lipid II flippase